MGPVQYVWLVPALPLAAMLIIFLVTRPLVALTGQKNATGHHGQEVPSGGPDAAAQARDQSSPAPGHGMPGAHDTHDTHGGVLLEGGADEPDAAMHGGGHAGHGGPTPLWGIIGSVIGVGALAGSFVLSLAILIQFLSDPALQRSGYTLHLYTWFTFGPLRYSITFRVDPLTVIMLLVVTGVSMVVHLYSVGYMAGDPGFSRFFIELALFTVAMLILVLAANFLVLFIGWELVGLSSYLLIGFWFDQAPPPPDSEVPYPPPAQVKAFVTTRLGDFGFLIGILILFTTTGTFNFIALDSLTRGVNVATITLAMILIFCGAIGKSAQFPLHVWLPDAMAGPTPVSALIHAATMVAAGVYLVARLFPIYYAVAGPQALLVVGYIGGFTALFAATIALVQNDIKGVLAYSTISQLGYMFVGLAMGSDNALGIFHLFTHACFKALLFLGAGSVIHAVTVQDMRKMGGLARFMPITALCFLAATLAISGIPPFAGFWSKDAIIGAAYERGNYILYGITLFTALLTAFYMFRLYFRTFGGPGGRFAGFGGRGATFQSAPEIHPHESPWMMTVPLVLLAIASCLVGFWSLNNGFATFVTAGAITIPYAFPFADPLTYVGVATAVLGIIIAWAMYGAAIVPADILIRNPVGAFMYRVFKNGYYLNELYMWLINHVALGLAALAAGVDRVVIDGVVNGAAGFVHDVGDTARKSETGFVQNYGAAIFGGTMILLIAVYLAVNGIH